MSSPRRSRRPSAARRSEEHTSELQSLRHLVCRLLLEKKKKITHLTYTSSQKHTSYKHAYIAYQSHSLVDLPSYLRTSSLSPPQHCPLQPPTYFTTCVL